MSWVDKNRESLKRVLEEIRARRARAPDKNALQGFGFRTREIAKAPLTTGECIVREMGEISEADRKSVQNILASFGVEGESVVRSTGNFMFITLDEQDVRTLIAILTRVRRGPP